MKFSLEREGLLDPRQFDAWRYKKREQIHRGTMLGMKDAAARIVPRIRAQAGAALKIRRPLTLKSFTATVHARRKDILPVVDFYSRIPWMGIHARGGVIQGPVLIPLTEEGKRMGPKKFRLLIRALIHQGNAFFKNVNGKVLLFAEDIKESARHLKLFRKANRARAFRGARSRLEMMKLAGRDRDREIPIAILLPRVELRKRVRMHDIVRQNLPLIASSIEKRISNG